MMYLIENYTEMATGTVPDIMDYLFSTYRNIYDQKPTRPGKIKLYTHKPI